MLGSLAALHMSCKAAPAAACFVQIQGCWGTGGDGVVSMWDAQNKKRISQIPGYETSVAALAFSGCELVFPLRPLTVTDAAGWRGITQPFRSSNTAGLVQPASAALQYTVELCSVFLLRCPPLSKHMCVLGRMHFPVSICLSLVCNPTSSCAACSTALLRLCWLAGMAAAWLLRQATPMSREMCRTRQTPSSCGP